MTTLVTFSLGFFAGCVALVIVLVLGAGKEGR